MLCVLILCNLAIKRYIFFFFYKKGVKYALLLKDFAIKMTFFYILAKKFSDAKVLINLL